jgi:3-hydroxyacyl-CoA dehydrogenase/enoyl-CoA hydratase/3-hydroxybutyryl-CoA epimerase/enoyl-CoA isomerase
MSETFEMVYHTQMKSESVAPPDQTKRAPAGDAAAAGPDDLCVVLVGAGVVGRAILAEHVRAGIDTWLVDTSRSAIESALASVAQSLPQALVTQCNSPLAGSIAARIATAETRPRVPNLLIESISENLDLKQRFFAEARAALGPSCVLATNTSNLGVGDIFAQLSGDSASLGLHFFMPVDQRPLIEWIRRPETSAATLDVCQRLAVRLGKSLLATTDSPGFVVNRLLAPYLNQSLLLLGRGADPESVAVAAERFGMPLSPLALIDLIGIRTAFDSGRVFWRHFPKRIDPAPILSGMIKAKRLGNEFGGGFYDVQTGDKIHPDAHKVIRRYLRDETQWDDQDLLECLTIPMWIEAAEALAAGVVDSFQAIETAMRGGLGYRNPDGFFGFFESLGRDRILSRLRSSGGQPALTANPALLDQLVQSDSVSAAIARYVGVRSASSRHQGMILKS